MKYSQTIVLKDGTEAYLRIDVASDGNAVFENFNLTDAEIAIPNPFPAFFLYILYVLILYILC